MNYQQLGQPHPLRYNAYLVRLWQDGPQAAWRASAQSVQTGETIRFADVAALFTFLTTQTAMNLSKKESTHEQPDPANHPPEPAAAVPGSASHGS